MEPISTVRMRNSWMRIGFTLEMWAVLPESVRERIKRESVFGNVAYMNRPNRYKIVAMFH